MPYISYFISCSYYCTIIAFYNYFIFIFIPGRQLLLAILCLSLMLCIYFFHKKLKVLFKSTGITENSYLYYISA